MASRGTLARVKITRCSRCGQDHDDVEARPLDRAFAPPEAAPLKWTHWAPCPTNGQPIMFIVTDVNDAREAKPGSP